MKVKEQELNTDTDTDTNMETYHYYGDVVSGYEVAGKEVMLHPGQEVSLPANDDTVKSLVGQALLVKYELQNKRQ